MAKIIKKRKNFTPTGEILGEFSPVDMQNVDMYFTDTDGIEMPKPSLGGMGGEPPKVPEPYNPNPLKKVEMPQPKGDGSNPPPPPDHENPKNDDNPQVDPKGQPNDPFHKKEKDEYNHPKKEGEGGEGLGGGSSTEGEQPKGGETQSDPNAPKGNKNTNGENGENTKDNKEGEKGSTSNTGNTGNTDNSNSDNSEKDGNTENGGDSEEGQDGKEGKEGENSNTNGKSTDGKTSEGDKQGENDENGEKGENNGNSKEGDDKEKRKGNEASNGNIAGDKPNEDAESELQKEIKKALAKKTATQKQTEKAEKEGIQKQIEKSAVQKQREAEEAKRIIEKAWQDMDINDTGEDSGEDSGEGGKSKGVNKELDLFKNLGAGKITDNLPKYKDLESEWKSKLTKLFENATGFKDTYDPEARNKLIRVKGPWGNESFKPELKDIVIAIDTSSSMGAGKFKQVIAHLDTILKNHDIGKPTFHIIAWGNYDSADSIINGQGNLRKAYAKTKNKKQVKSLIMSTCGFAYGGTDIYPLFALLRKKVKSPDAIIIMTDGEIWMGNYGWQDNSVVKNYIQKKNRHRIIWALTKGSRHSMYNTIKEIDPHYAKDGRWIEFSGT